MKNKNTNTNKVEAGLIAGDASLPLISVHVRAQIRDLVGQVEILFVCLQQRKTENKKQGRHLNVLIFFHCRSLFSKNTETIVRFRLRQNMFSPWMKWRLSVDLKVI